MNVSRSSFNDNSASSSGGAINALRGRLRVSNSTFNDNYGYQGAGIHVDGADATLTHLTLAENRSAYGGDGLYSRAGLVRLQNSIVVGFRNSQEDCVGNIEQRRGNLISDWSCRAPLGGNPLLGEYEAASGYRPLRDGSPALDAADPEFCLATDQIGTPRPHGGNCDIGAIESTSAALSSVPIKSICNLSFQITAANQGRWIGSCPPGDGADTIELTEDITLTEPLPRIASEIPVEGNVHTISGDNRFPIFRVHRGNLTIKDLTLSNGNAYTRSGGALSVGRGVVSATNVDFINNVAFAGGAISAGHDCQLRVTHSRLLGNTASYTGGAIEANGQVEISHSILSHNSAEEYGGAILSNETLRIDNSTLAHNEAHLGGGIYIKNDDITLTHVSLINNHGWNGGDAIYRRERDWGKINLRISVIAGGYDKVDCVGHLDQNVGNLIEDGSCNPDFAGDPRLTTLTGAPDVFAPQDASPAIDSADPHYCPPTDQLGNSRPQGDGCDIGAIEYIGGYTWVTGRRIEKKR